MRSQNRFRPPQYFSVAAFERLEELQLNATFTTWEEFQAIIPHMPALASVELGYNGLRSADKVQGHDTARWPQNSAIRSINLDGNELDQFADACARMHNLSASEFALAPPPCCVLRSD